MEPIRVTLRNWPLEGVTSGWVVPSVTSIDHWAITRVHAAYLAPELRDDSGAVIRPELRAHLVDLAGRFDLPDLERAFLYQVPQLWWMLRVPDREYLARREKYRIGHPGGHAGRPAPARRRAGSAARV